MTVKRVRTDSPPKSMLLKVSGRKFEIGTSTLREMQWFEPILAGRFHHPDVFFIDFDPDIFSVILQSVRVHRPPPRQVLVELERVALRVVPHVERNKRKDARCRAV